jgi:hypothetical protein
MRRFAGRRAPVARERKGEDFLALAHIVRCARMATAVARRAHLALLACQEQINRLFFFNGEEARRSPKLYYVAVNVTKMPLLYEVFGDLNKNNLNLKQF